MEKVGVLASVVNFGTAWENVGVPLCMVNCGATRKIIMCRYT
jgi:hypothetical protein